MVLPFLRIVLMYPQFYILHFTFTIHNEILRRFAPQDDRRGGNTNARLCHPERSGELHVSRAVERVS